MRGPGYRATKCSLSDVPRFVNLLLKVTLFYRPIMTPPAGRKDSWGGAATGPARMTNHPNPFYADHPWLPFHRCPMRRSFYKQRVGSNLDEIFPLWGSLLHDIPHIVAEKPANKGWQRPAEQMEPRAAAKVNPGGRNTCRTQRRVSVSQAADWIRKQRRGTRRGVPCIECRWPAGIPGRSCRRENPTAGGNDHSTLPARQ